MFKRIIHIADIHFPHSLSSNPIMYKRYELWQDQFLAMTHLDNTTLVVIAGDTLHDYDRADPFLVSTVQLFLKRLQDVAGAVIVILGNHDYNHGTWQSWIPLMNNSMNDNIHILLESGQYKYDNITVDFQSITDPFKSYFFENRDKPRDQNADLHIAVFHGILYNTKVKGLSTRNNNTTTPCTTYAIDRSWFCAHDYVLLGHIHTHQSIGKFIYAGSAMQQSFGESIHNHGFVEITISDKSWKFVEIPPILSYINMQMNESIPEIPSTCKYITLQVCSQNAVVASEREQYENMIRSMLPDHIISSTIRWKRIVDTNVLEDNISSSHTSSPNNNGLLIKRCSWCNVFCYGPDESVLVFDDTIKSISAANTYGKTTVWRIILVALYADAFKTSEKRSFMENIVNAHAKKGQIVLDGILNNHSFHIERIFTKNVRTIIKSTLIVDNEVYPLTWLVNNIMPLDVLRSNYVLSRSTESIFEKSSTRLQQYMNMTFHLDELHDRMVEVDKAISSNMASISTLKKLISTMPEIINLDESKSELTRILTLEPVNTLQDYASISNTLLNNILSSMNNNSISTDINVTADEFDDIISFLKKPVLSTIMPLAVRKGILTSDECIRIDNILAFATCAELKPLTSVDIMKAIMPLQDKLPNDLHDRYDQCTILIRLVKPFLKIVGKLPTISEPFSPEVCEMFLKQASPMDYSSDVTIPDTVELPDLPCNKPTPINRLSRLIQDPSNTEFLQAITQVMAGKDDTMILPILERLRNDDDAIQLLRAKKSDQKHANIAELTTILASVKYHIRSLYDTIITQLYTKDDKAFMNTIMTKITNYCQNIASQINNKQRLFRKTWDTWSERVNRLKIEISNNEQLNENRKRINTEILSIQSKLDALREERNRLNDKRVSILEKDISSLENIINSKLHRYVQLQVQISVHETAQKLQFSIDVVDGTTIRSYDHLSGYERVIISFVTMRAFNMLGDYRFNVFYIDEAFDVLDEDNFSNLDNLLRIAHTVTPNVLFVTHRPILSQSVITIERDALGRSKLCNEA